MSLMFYTLLALVCAAAGQVDEGSCQCAVFKKEALTEECVPLISKTPAFAVACNDEGKESCLQMCTALAQAAKEQAPEMLCQVVGTLNEGIKPAVFSKACEAEKWTYTGMTAKESICCAGGKAIACQPDNTA